MLVAELSKSDSFGGGASRVAEDLAHGLRASGVECHHWSRFSSKGFDRSANFPLYGSGLPSRLLLRIRRLEDYWGLTDFIPLELLTLKRHNWMRYDVLHFHDLSTAISPLTLQYMSRKRPVIWTFHDCSPFTAGCITPVECEKYKNCCGHCPKINQWPFGGRFDCTRTLAKLKARLHRTRRLITITPSKWLRDKAMESGMLIDAPRIIPNGVDTGIFVPNECRNEAKAFLGIETDRPVILVSAGSLTNRLKGIEYSLEAICSIKDLHPFVLAIGSSSSEFEEHLSGVDHICTSYISDQRVLARWFALADVFVYCSLADNMPLVLLETMACGVPVVGFKTGGIPEMVEQDVTGYLVDQKDQNSLNKVLRHALTSGSVKRWGVESRRKAVNEYSMDRFISAHKSLYEDVIAKFKETHR